MKNLAIQSFCFRGFKDNAEVAAMIKRCGGDGVELCRIHADFADRASHESVIDTYRNAGIEIPSIGVLQFGKGSDTERACLDFAKTAGCRTVSVNFQPGLSLDAFCAAEALAEEYDIRLAIHNHGGHHWLGNRQMLRAVFAETSPRIGLMLDTAWALDAHEDPVAMADEFGERLYGVHLKDFVFDRSGKQEDVVVGAGNLKLPQLMHTLRQHSFDGNLILEYEGDVDDPAPALSECVNVIREEMNHA